jgi:hypothetical protein
MDTPRQQRSPKLGTLNFHPDFPRLREMWQNGETSAAAAAKALDTTRGMFQYWAKATGAVRLTDARYYRRKPRESFARVYGAYREGKIDLKTALAELGVTATTFHRWAKESNLDKKCAGLTVETYKKKNCAAFPAYYEKWQAGKISSKKASAELGIEMWTFLRWGRQYTAARGGDVRRRGRRAAGHAKGGQERQAVGLVVEHPKH